jgi:hypothetical protein
MHVTRILPETFKPMETASTYTGPNYWVLFTVGDVEADGKIYKGCAIRIIAQRDAESSSLQVIFKGKNRIRKASDWLSGFSGGHWGEKQHNWLDIMAGDDDNESLYDDPDDDYDLRNRTFMPANIE